MVKSQGEASLILPNDNEAKEFIANISEIKEAIPKDVYSGIMYGILHHLWMASV